MKHRNFRSFLHKLRRVRQKGQALVEYILLLSIMAIVSFLFVSVMNSGLSRYWGYAVNLVIDDKPGTNTVEFR